MGVIFKNQCLDPSAPNRAALRCTALLWALAAGTWAGAGVCVGLEGGPGDFDGDGLAAAVDCADDDANLQAPPGLVEGLQVSRQSLSWQPPLDPGGTENLIYNVFRSRRSDFAQSECVHTALDQPSTPNSDTPLPGETFFYLVESENSCGSNGTGFDSAGSPRAPVQCSCSVVCDDQNACTLDSCSAGSCTNTLIEPELAQAPAPATACDGGDAEFQVSASGNGPLSYQWFANGSPVGNNASRLTLSNLGPGDDGTLIEVEVTDGCTTSTSPPARLSVLANASSCDGGLDGQESPTGATRMVTRGGPVRWMAPEAIKERGHVGPVRWMAPESIRSRTYDSSNTGGVHGHSGEYTRTDIDLVIPGRGFDFVWSRTYRSREFVDTAQGHQWTHGYARRVEQDAVNPQDRLVHDGTMARRDRYSPSTLPDCWESPGLYRTLCQQPDGRYVLTFPDRHQWVFRPLDGTPGEGAIESQSDRNGNSMTFQYDAQGHLDTIVDTLGRSITVSYDAQRRIDAITDFIGRSVTYDYYGPSDLGGSDGDLRSATSPTVTGTPHGNDFPQGKTTTYTYTQGFSSGFLDHNLLTVTDPLGQTFVENVYGATQNPGDGRFDRIAYQIHLGEVLAYTYPILPPDPSLPQIASTTVVNDRSGNVSRYDFDGAAQLLRERHFTGRAPDPAAPSDTLQNQAVSPLRAGDPPSYDTTYAYNAGGMTTRIDLPNRSSTLLVYDEANADPLQRADLLQRTRSPGALGGDQATIQESWTYTTGFSQRRVPSLETLFESPARPATAVAAPFLDRFASTYTDGRGFVTSYTHDPNGNPTVLRRPTVVSGTLGGGQQVIEQVNVYNAFGQVTQVTTPAGRVDTFDYFTTGPEEGYLAQIVIDAPGTALSTSFGYDTAGNMTDLTDPRGNLSQHTYNELDQMVRSVSPSPQLHIRYFWQDRANRLIRVDQENKDESQTPRANAYLSRAYRYDELDRVVEDQIETAAGGECIQRTYAYDPNGNVARADSGESTNGNQPDNYVTRQYDERDLLFVETRASGSADQASVQLDYTANGELAAIRSGLEDPSGSHDTTWAYDGYDRPTQRTDAMGNVETYNYNANGKKTRLRVQGEALQGSGQGTTRLAEVSISYDEVDRPIQTDTDHFDIGTGQPILDGSGTIQVFYDADDRPLRVTDDRGNSTDMTYDGVRRLLSRADAGGNTLTFAYDDRSNLRQVTRTDLSDLGLANQVFTTTYTYDALNRHDGTTDNLGRQWTYGHDSQDLRTLTVDSLGNVTRTLYDGADRPLQTIHELTDDGTGSGNPSGTVIINYEWDDNDRLSSMTDGNGNITQYAYDALDRPTSTSYADGTSTSRVYDVHQRVTTLTDANGTVISYDHDDLDRVTGVQVVPAAGVGGTTTETYDYDGLSRLRVADDDDSSVTLDYDSMGNVLRETLSVAGGPGRTTESSFDGAGNELQRRYPSGRTIDYQYDALNRVNGMSEGNSLASFFYIGPDRVERISRANGTDSSYEHDALGRTTRTVHEAAGIPWLDLGTTWSPADTLEEFRDNLNAARFTRYSYDSLYRMTESERNDPGPLVETVTYVYDGAGNRTTVTGGSEDGTYTMDPAQPTPADRQCNQYTTTPRGSRTYDGKGATLSADDRTGIVYDYRDQMIEVTVPGRTFSYRYDALGRRIEASGGGTTRRYYWSGQTVIEEQDGQGIPQVSYVGGPDGLLQMREEVDLNGDQALDDLWYHVDFNESVRSLTDGTGAAVESYDYDDFGLPIGGPGSRGNVYLFGGMRWDADTRLYRTGGGYFDPSAGRHTSRQGSDTLGHSTTYGMSNPHPWVPKSRGRAEGGDYNSSRSNRTHTPLAAPGGGGEHDVIYVFGGTRGRAPGEGGDYNSSRSNRTHTPLAGPGGGSHRDVIYIFGGTRGRAPGEGGDYNSSRSNRTHTPNAAPGGGGGHDVIYIFGGTRGRAPAEGGDYNSSRSNRTHTPNAAPGGGGGHDVIYIFGGTEVRAPGEGGDYNSSRSNRTHTPAAGLGGGGGHDVIYIFGGTRGRAPAEGGDYNSSRSNRTHTPGNGTNSQDDGVIRDFVWTQVSGPGGVMGPGGGSTVPASDDGRTRNFRGHGGKKDKKR
ncbi:hypothetical protein ABI59_17655 [Acidobacteria bacterium Mor1]|nr:hypothetical protein ABI59_17655 [Acidobacteria bacterium Mor1]